MKRAASSIFVCVVACAGTKPATVADGSAPAPVAEAVPAADAPQQPPTSEPWDEQEAFMAVFAALRSGNWAELEPYTGSSIAYERSYSISDDPPERASIAPGGARTWLDEAAATWAPHCADAAEPPCRSFNPLSLGTPDESLPTLMCEAGCCRHEPAMLHNTPFLAELCFDEQHRVSRVVVIDG